MSIRPVDFNGMIQRTQDVSTLKQNEDNRPVVEQQTIFSQEMKKWSRISIRWFMPRKKRMPVIVTMPKKREMGIMKRKNGRKKTRSSKRLTMFI